MMYCLGPEMSKCSSGLVVSAFCGVEGNGTAENPMRKAKKQF